MKLILTIIIIFSSLLTLAQQRCNHYNEVFDSTANFRGAEFDSTANFRGAEFNSTADFWKAEFNSTADFGVATFDSTANFWGAIFDSTADFWGATFDSTANFGEAEFNSTADFGYATFNSTADFWRATFDSTANFGEAEFNSTADFGYATFNSTANFREAEFNSTADFGVATFDSTANFRGAEFDSTANFRGAEFNSTADFWGATFDSIANFRGAEFGSNVYFDTLPELLFLNDVKHIQNEIDLTYSTINPEYNECNICLNNSNIDKIKFRYSRFKLYFPNNTEPEIKSNVYEKLLAKQKKEGYNTSIEKLEKEYQEFRYLESGEYSKTWGYLSNWVSKNWWGYGYDKELIIRNTILLFLFFSLINSFFFKLLLLKLYEMPKLLEIRNEIKPVKKFYLFFKVFPIAAFYTGCIFFGLNFKTDKLKYSENLKGWKIFRLVYFFTVYIIGLICIGYLANYVITSQ